MKSVLISIQPQWCELIVTGDKTLEVRKTRPKLEPPFKCYIYCTKSDDMFWVLNTISRAKYGFSTVCANLKNVEFATRGDGKVIGEFTCNKILSIGRRGVNNNFDYCYESLNTFGNDDIEHYITAIRKSCIGKNELNEYAKDNPCLYGWHISNLKIYDTPLDLSNFFHACDKPSEQNCSVCEESGKASCKQLRHAPQSWCYVMELQ